METVATIIAAMIIGGMLVIGATAFGRQQELCDAMGGKYIPSAAPEDICPGGTWVTLIGLNPLPR